MTSRTKRRNKKAREGVPLFPGFEWQKNGKAEQLDLDLDTRILKGIPDGEAVMRRMLALREELAILMDAHSFCKHLFPQPEDDGVIIVQKVVARVCGVNVLRMYVSDRGNSDLVTARQIAMHIAFNRGLGSKTALAPRFNRLDHGTIIHACDTVAERLENGVDPKFKALYDECVEALKPYTLKAIVDPNRAPVPASEVGAMKA